MDSTDGPAVISSLGGRIHSLTWRKSSVRHGAADPTKEAPQVPEALKALARLLGRQAARRIAQEYP